jgi:hypothetical protein
MKAPPMVLENVSKNITIVNLYDGRELLTSNGSGERQRSEIRLYFDEFLPLSCLTTLVGLIATEVSALLKIKQNFLHLCILPFFRLQAS